MTLRTESETIVVRVGQVTANLFNVLRAEPIVGRDFRPEEDVPGQGGVAILSEGLWNSRFARDPDIVGAEITLEGTDRAAAENEDCGQRNSASANPRID